MTRCGDVIPAPGDTDDESATRKKPDLSRRSDAEPDGQTFPLAFNPAVAGLTGEPDRIFGDASGVVSPSSSQSKTPEPTTAQNLGRWEEFCGADFLKSHPHKHWFFCRETPRMEEVGVASPAPVGQDLLNPVKKLLGDETLVCSLVFLVDDPATVHRVMWSST